MVIRNWSRIIASVGLVWLLGWAVYTLHRTPCLGVADIYDFWRVMRPAGIEHLEPLARPGYFVVCTFKTDKAHLGSAPSSAALVAWLAKHLSWGLQPGPGRMSLRQMGRLCLVLIAFVTMMGLKSRASPILMSLMLYVLVDPGFLLFFNSFYADATFFIALFGVTIWLERHGKMAPELWDRDRLHWVGMIIGLWCLAALGGASKMQYVFFPLFILASIGIPLFIHGRRRPARAALVAVVLVVISGAVSWLFFFGPGPRFLKANNYHAVYGGIVRVASDPEGVLESLGVPPKFWDLPRTDYWSADIGESHSVHRHLRHLSRIRLLRLYAGDPRAVLMVLESIEGALASVETDPRGHSVRDADNPKKYTRRTWWQFSRIHGALYGAWPAIVWFILGGSISWVVAALYRRRWDGATAAALFLVMWVTSQLVIVVLGEGLVNLKQHLVGTRLALDLLIVLVGWDAALAMKRRFVVRRR